MDSVVISAWSDSESDTMLNTVTPAPTTTAVGLIRSSSSGQSWPTSITGAGNGIGPAATPYNQRCSHCSGFCRKSGGGGELTSYRGLYRTVVKASILPPV